MSAPTATIIYMKKAPPLRPAEGCKHGGADALVVNQRIEKDGRRNRMACDALLCMACGTIRPVAEYRNYHDALADFWREFGWNRELGMRLTELADLSTSTPFESYMALATGRSPDELAAHLAETNTTAPSLSKAKMDAWRRHRVELHRQRTTALAA